MKFCRRTLPVLLCLVLCVSYIAFADESFNMSSDGFSTTYTYDYDYWGDAQEVPDAYRVASILDGTALGLDALGGKAFSRPQSLFVRGNDLYVADTGNNRIVVLTSENGVWSVKNIIDSISGDKKGVFSSPYDIFVDEEENLYVADNGAYRVVMMDKNGSFIREFVKPTDATFDQANDFLPKKIVADDSGRLYVLAQNINKGLVKFESDGTFTGFIGANQVTVSMADYIWKRYFQSDAQRAQSAAFVPTEYENLYIDGEGFIYVTTTTFDEYDLKWDNAKPIRRLNSLGNDILIKNDRYPPIGDLYWVEQDNNYYGPSRFTDITVLQDDIYVALDRTRGRLFGYDSQGVMLWAFGSRGTLEGAFNSPVALEHMGRDLIVLDQQKNNITVFSPTEYGTLIYDAISTYQKGDYDASAVIWEQVMKLNANYPLAFRGIGRVLLRQDKFKEAMEYFELAHDKENYGRAFKLFRKEWVETNVWWIVLILAVVLIVPLVIGRIKRAKWEVMMHEHNQVHKNV